MYDVIVVGAGVVGSATAYHLAKGGKEVLLLDQTGVLSVCFDRNVMESASRSLKQAGIKHHRLENKELKQKYPMLECPDNSTAIVEDDGGMLYADKCIQALQRVLIENGGHIIDGEPVLEVVPGEPVTVRTVKNSYQANHLVLTLGPWAPKMLTNLGIYLPLKPNAVTVMYWKEKKRGLFSADRFPCLRYISVIQGKHNLYGLPCDEYPGLFKLCLHEGEVGDPEVRDRRFPEFDVKTVSSFISKHIPDLESKPSVVERCYYTMTPDVDYVLDKHPRWPNIVIGAGFSGHGFKLAPVSGKILANLVNDQPNPYPMEKFSVHRFYEKKSTKASRL